MQNLSDTDERVTEKKNISEKLTANEDKFRNASHYSAIGMALADLNRHWIDVNPALCEMLGYSKNELSELTFQDITYPEDLSQNLAYVEQVLKREIESFTLRSDIFIKMAILYGHA